MGRRKSFMDLVDDGPMEVTDAAELPPTRVLVAKCVRRPDNPRLDDLAVTELAETIVEFGQMQPATIASREAYLRHRPQHAEAIGAAEWVVLAGNRRHAACEKAGVDTLLVHVDDEGVEKAIEIGIIENIQREPLPPTLEARELAKLMERYGTTRAVGSKIGKSHVYVSQRLALLELVTELQRAVDEGSLKIADARELARLPQDEQLAAFEAGPPYKDKPQPEPLAPSVPEPETVNGNGSLGNAVSKPEPTGEGVDGHAAAARGAGNAVSKPRDSASASGVGNGVSNTRSSAVALPAEPEALVELIRSEYSEEQRQKLVALLQG